MTQKRSIRYKWSNLACSCFKLLNMTIHESCKSHFKLELLRFPALKITLTTLKCVLYYAASLLLRQSWMKDQGTAFSGNHQVCSTPSPPVPNLCKQPVVPAPPTFLLCCHCLLTQGCEDQGAQPALCLSSLGCHWWEHTPSWGQWWRARVFLVLFQSWPLGLYDLLCAGSWDAILGLCSCCWWPAPGWHSQLSTHESRKAPLVTTARSPHHCLPHLS